MNNPLKQDPSRTTLIRAQFLSDMQRRFTRIKRAVRQLLVVEDALGLKPNEEGTVAKLIFNKRYAFLTNPEKVKAFRSWLQGQIDNETLSVDTNGKPWTAKYVDSAYRKGVVRSYIAAHKKEIGKSGDFYAGTRKQFLQDLFAQPEMLSKVQMLGTRAFEDLKGVTATMAGQMNRLLADGIANGDSPDRIASAMSNAIDGITKKRALVIARTEVIHAHAEGQLDSLEFQGVELVQADVEFMTSGDKRVCPQCEALGGEIYTIAEARGVIPVHPSCRCAWSPSVRPTQGQLDRFKKRQEEAEVDEARPGSQAYQIESVLGDTAKTIRQISEETGIPTPRISAHMQSMLKKGTATKTDDGWVLGGEAPPIKTLKPLPGQTELFPPIEPKAELPRWPTEVATAKDRVLEKKAKEVVEDLVVPEFKTEKEISDWGRENLKTRVELSSEEGMTGKAISKALEVTKTIADLRNRFAAVRQFLDEKSLTDYIVLRKGTKFTAEHTSYKDAPHAVLGLYNAGSRKLQIASGLMIKERAPSLGEFIVGADIGSITRHEWGHHFWYQSLGSKVRVDFGDKFRSYYKSSNFGGHTKGKKGIPVSFYAQTNVQEFFAESFAAYTNPKYIRGSLPSELEAFLDKHVKGE